MSRHRALRAGLLALAVVFLCWEAFGAIRWVADGGGPGLAAKQFWAHLIDDWMLLIVVTDHLLLAGLVLVLLWLDAARAGWRVGQRFGLAAAFVALGSPVILWYLAWRVRPVRTELRGTAEARA